MVLRNDGRLKLSVVIPSYNNAKFLRAAIESAIAMLPEGSGEVVLVDDCSSDGSYAMALEYKKAIRVYKNKNNWGQELTTNRGLKLARGEYAVILHSDDILHRNFYADLSVLLEQYPSAVMAVGERVEIDSSEKTIAAPAPFYDHDYLIPGVEQSKIFLLTSFLPCQVLFRRKVVLSFGGAKKFFNVNLDGLLWFKASLFGDVAYTQKCVCSYRRHLSSTTSSLNRSIVHLFEYYSTLKEMFIFAGERGLALEESRTRAFCRIAELAVRYGKEIYAAGNADLSRRYLMLAAAIDPRILESAAYLDVEKTIREGMPLASGLSARTVSYPPPPGSRQI